MWSNLKGKIVLWSEEFPDNRQFSSVDTFPYFPYLTVLQCIMSFQGEIRCWLLELASTRKITLIDALLHSYHLSLWKYIGECEEKSMLINYMTDLQNSTTSILSSKQEQQKFQDKECCSLFQHHTAKMRIRIISNDTFLFWYCFPHVSPTFQLCCFLDLYKWWMVKNTLTSFGMKWVTGNIVVWSNCNSLNNLAKRNIFCVAMELKKYE